MLPLFVTVSVMWHSSAPFAAGARIQRLSPTRPGKMSKFIHTSDAIYQRRRRRCCHSAGKSEKGCDE